MTRAERALADYVQRVVARMEPRMQRAYLAALAQLAKELGPAYVLGKLQAGRLDDIITPGMLDRALMRLKAELQRGAQEGFTASLKQLPGGSMVNGAVSVGFNVLNPRVQDALRRLEDQILRGFSDTVRETVRQHLLAAIEAGISPAQAAKGVRDIIGLTPYQEQIVRNFEASLRRIGDKAGIGDPKAMGYQLRDKRFDRTLQKLHKAGKPLSAKQVEAMTAAYRNRFVAYHARVVARTATLNAYRTGQHESVMASIQGGLGNLATATKTWVTVGDSRVRPEHVDMAGETVPVTGTFSNGLDIPSEWQCRCILRYTLVPPPQPQRAR